MAFGTDAMADVKPEGLFELSGTTAVRFHSDDGDVQYGKRVCKDVPAAPQAIPQRRPHAIGISPVRRT
ncbi:hypothetical protein [Cupriavidus sp. H39]|uniref:hypothetical protein n=1 Tax=Cupriavidus sp. H39 TaxID=3401635 RepID=UPI003CFE8AAF